MKHLRTFALGVAASVLLAGTVQAQPKPIRIGEINSYKSQPAFLEPYKNQTVNPLMKLLHF